MTHGAVQASHLCKRFQQRDVLINVQVEIAEAECLAIIGDNGCGKTTLLRCLSGVTRPTSGTLRWFGREGPPPDVRRLIGSVAHDPGIYPQLTVRENLMFAARMHGVRQPMPRARELMERCGLGQVAEQPGMSLSRGMCQRVAIARALVHDPLIILLDEPFTGLDLGGAEMLAELLKSLRARGRTTCFTSHHTTYVSRLASRIARLHAGELHDMERTTDTWKRQSAA